MKLLLVVVDAVVLVVAAALAAEAEAAEGEGQHQRVQPVEEVRAQPDCAGRQLGCMGCPDLPSLSPVRQC